MQVKFVIRKFFFNLRDFLSIQVVGLARWQLVEDLRIIMIIMARSVLPQQVVRGSDEETTEE